MRSFHMSKTVFLYLFLEIFCEDSRKDMRFEKAVLLRNIHMIDATAAKITSMHFHGWQRGLKTGMWLGDVNLSRWWTGGKENHGCYDRYHRISLDSIDMLIDVQIGEDIEVKQEYHSLLSNDGESFDMTHDQSNESKFNGGTCIIER